MNETILNRSIYAQKVELLLRLIPIVMEEEVFAIHGGSAINLFLKDLPRYSVDIDLTYIPLADRSTSLNDINLHLKSISDKAKKAFKGMHIVPVPNHPQWEGYEFEYFKYYPSVQWKILNLQKLSKQNPNEEVIKLKSIWSL